MVGYPYYFLGTDSLFDASISFGSGSLFNAYGGVIGTCPWSPSLSDPFNSVYPYPINESIQLFTEFNTRWNQYYEQNETRSNVVYNYQNPGYYTGYAYDNILSVIKAINEYVGLYGFDVNNSNITAQFKEILHRISFIGLTGNVSYDTNGDRTDGLFAFCNIDPLTGDSFTIGYIIDNEDLFMEVNESLIKWPHDFVPRGMPQSEYIKYKGIPQNLFIFVCVVVAISIKFTLICMIALIYFRKREIIKSSQWKLSVFMCIGIIITYLTIILFGIDEELEAHGSIQSWKIYCNSRLLMLSIGFAMSFGPLFCKVYRIRNIFHYGNKLKDVAMTAEKMILYTFIYAAINCVLCSILLIFIPMERTYEEAHIYDIERELYGNCSAEYWWIYGLVLILPNFCVCVYAVIVSIFVYNTVSMMKYNEGLQVLTTVILSMMLLLIMVLTLSMMEVDSERTAGIFYGMLSLILLIVCNFCVVMMLLPRLCAIWRGTEEIYLKQNENDVRSKATVYLSSIKTLTKQDSSKERSLSPMSPMSGRKPSKLSIPSESPETRSSLYTP